MRSLVLGVVFAAAVALVGADTAWAKKCKGCGGGCCYSCGSCGACGSCGGGGCPGGVCPVPGATKKAELDANRAYLVVTLPEDAKLTIDDGTTVSTSETRTFVTPELQKDKEFVYNLKAQIVREGKTLTLTKQAVVRAGKETKIALDIPAQAVAVK